MNVSIIGTGYVGLISGVSLASKGHHVTCVDKRKEVVSLLNNKQPHIYEKGLDKLLAEVIDKGTFKVTDSVERALRNSTLVLVAVGTPSENGRIDLSQISDAIKEIAQYIKRSSDYISVIIKSTVVPGTTDTFVRNILEEVSGKNIGDFGIGMNPEFLREGDAITDFMYPDRVVIGYEDSRTMELLSELYSPWDCEKIFVNCRTAEMIKYANNTILAALISLNNELSNHSALLGNIDYMNVVHGISTDKRWSPIVDGKRIKPAILEYLVPGTGFGGSCFPKDVQAIRTQGESLSQPMDILNAVLKVNENQPSAVMSILKEKAGGFINKKVIVLGLAFKSDTDDIRESTALKVINYLLVEGASIYAHDPIAIDNTKKMYESSNVNFVTDWTVVLSTVDIIIVATNWPEYKMLVGMDDEGILSGKIIFDCKRLFKTEHFTNNTFLTTGRS